MLHACMHACGAALPGECVEIAKPCSTCMQGVAVDGAVHSREDAE